MKMLRQYFNCNKYWKYFWHISAIFWAMWAPWYENTERVLGYWLLLNFLDKKLKLGYWLLLNFLDKKLKFNNCLCSLTWLTLKSRFYPVFNIFNSFQHLNLAAFKTELRSLGQFEGHKGFVDEFFLKTGLFIFSSMFV